MKRTVVITGASAGIGLGIAQRFAADGYNVCIAARDPHRVGIAQTQLSATGVDVIGIAADLSRRDEVERVIDESASAFGSIDVLVNNVGASVFGKLREIDDQAWIDAFELKFLGCVRASRAVIPWMTNPNPSIINIAGTGGTVPSPSHLAGGASNAAIIHFTKAVSQDLASLGIRVNCISPGPIMTDRWRHRTEGLAEDGRLSYEQAVARREADVPLGRLGRPDEVAAAAAFLASSDSSFVNGINLIVDGGTTRGT